MLNQYGAFYQGKFLVTATDTNPARCYQKARLALGFKKSWTLKALRLLGVQVKRIGRIAV